MNIVGIAVPLIIILLSYGKIWHQTRKNQKVLMSFLDNDSPVRYRAETDTTKLARTLLLICFSFLLFVIPFIIYQSMVDVGIFEGNHFVAVTIYCCYWLQFCTNFFIYAVSNEQYRKAYLFFFQNVVFKTCSNQYRNKATDEPTQLQES